MNPLKITQLKVQSFFIEIDKNASKNINSGVRPPIRVSFDLGFCYEESCPTYNRFNTVDFVICDM